MQATCSAYFSTNILMITRSAPGKLILCGEHAVVYGQPAIAIPVDGVRATAHITAQEQEGVVFDAADLGERWRLEDRPEHPLSRLFVATLQRLGHREPPPLRIELHSSIPVASGMGSGAALAAALVEALAVYIRGAEDRQLSPQQVAELVFESERFYHGTPSGIDNTVVSYRYPIWFQRTPTVPIIEPITVGGCATLVVGDTGVRASTRTMVEHVRAGWRADPLTFDHLFAQIGQIVQSVRQLLGAGDMHAVGQLLDHNQRLLDQLGVGSLELQRLLEAARGAGAWGAKLSGGGGGGVMLALVDAQGADTVRRALREAGAVQVIETVLGPY